MKPRISLKPVLLALTALSTLAGAAASAEEHRLGQHPAVLVKRLEAQRGYDYAAKFYPHPAWLYLDATPGVPENMAHKDGKRKDPPAKRTRPGDVVARRP